MIKTIKMGLIGLGGMGKTHLKNMADIEGLEVTAVCDADSKRMDSFQGARFTNSSELINSGKVDAVLIATPHYFHTSVSIEALQKGLHVLVEKPIAAHIYDAKKMLEAHKDKNLVFAAMFNLRTDPMYRKLKNMVDNNELGKIVRVNWIITNWFRTYAYYTSGSWRATWKGEGGGVLLNQCAHNLDIIQWIAGQPCKVTANIGLGKYHDIEVEDEVTALLEYSGGATGVFITSTGEAPGTNRLEIAAEKGKVVLEDRKMKFVRNEIEMSEYSKTAKDMFGMPPSSEAIELDFTNGNGEQHVGIIKNFRDAILGKAELIAPVEEGIRSLELGNAMLLSGILKEPVEIPLDSGFFYSEFNKLIKSSAFLKR
ncbi:MAG: Gfo/Idh/MocA family oxidoreductase [Spirochaetes bacterium]|nr:Gfo/Idh/MocA family oxidoreductase [Spirochaetota bacterium]